MPRNQNEGDDHADTATGDILRKLVSFPTVSGDHRTMAGLLDYVEGYLTARGMHTRRVTSDGFVSLVATTRPGVTRAKVMLAAHADVVPADPAMFALRREGERLRGRGVMDMKFAIAVYMQLVDDIRDRLDDYDFMIVITPDEEIGGGHGLAAVMAEGYRAQVCLLPDGGQDWQIQTASKGYWAFEITASGRPAHGSRPWLGDNALLKLIAVLDAIAALFPRHTGMDTSTISLTRLSGGESMNQIPGTASMTVDIRTIDDADHQRIYDAVQKLCTDAGTTCDVISRSLPTTSDLSHPLIAPYVRAIRDVTGVEPTGWHAPATSDARYLVPHDIPFIAVYPTGGGHHTPDEWLDAGALEDFHVVTRRYLDDVGRRHDGPPGGR